MEPIPQTTEAIEEFGPFGYDDDLLDRLRAQADAVQVLVPDCVGVSLASLADGVTFTLVATDLEAGLLDALQYVGDGPCLEAVRDAGVLECDGERILDEEEWRLFASGTAALGVASSLSLPILADDAVVGSVNLYAASPRAFGGLHEDVARIFDAWAPGAVTNADLSFSTRRTAEEAPGTLRAGLRLEVAAAIVAGRRGVDLEKGRRLLDDAARRAGVSVTRLADTVIELGEMSED